MSDDNTGPRFWPLRWITDEKFWRDVVSQALGAGLVLFVGFIWAVAAGWLKPGLPTTGLRWAILTYGVLVLGASGVLIWTVVSGARELKQRGHDHRGSTAASIVVFGILIVLMTLPLFSYFFDS